MKRRFTILTAALALLAFLAIPMGVWGQTRGEVSLVALTFPDDNSENNGLTSNQYQSTWTATIGDFSWAISNFNNNNWANNWAYIKCGRKNNASVGKITTTEAYEQAITKVDLTINAITAANVNSIKLYASTDNDTWTEVGSFAKSTGLQTVTVASPAADQYYKIEFDCASGSSNGLVTVSKVEYYYNTSGASSPTISADNVELAYDATSGAIEYTVNNPVQGGELSATTNAEWITIGTVGETVPFTCTVNEGSIRTATVTLTYSYGNDNVTKDITVTQAANPNGPGSQANPYTVAQARAAIDAGTGTQGVYATGIVSAIPTAWNSQYSNITFDFVDNAGDTDVLEAYRCASGTGVDASQVAVGDVVVVYGNLTKYGSTYEFNSGCQLVSLTHPVITTPVVTVTPNTINAPAEGADGALAITYENIENFISFDYYFCDANGGELDVNPDWIYAEINEEDDTYSLDYLIDANDGAARTAYIKVYTFDDDLEEVYAIVTVNQEEYVAPTYAELPFEFDGVKADIENTDGLYQEGLGNDYGSSPYLKFDGAGDYVLLQFEERPGTLTFDIKGNGAGSDPWEGVFKVMVSNNGSSFVDKEVYETGELTSTKTTMTIDDLASDVRYIKWIYTTKTKGNVALGNINLAAYQAPMASITVDPATVDVNAEEHDGTLGLTYENLPITEMTDFDIQYYDAEGEETTEPDWIEVLVAEQDPEIGEGYVVSYYMIENEGEARTAYFKVYAMDDETNLVYSNLVTVSQGAYIAPSGNKYVKVTSTDDLTSGQYLIVYEDGGLAFDGSLESLDAVGNTIEVILNDDEIDITSETAAAEFTIDITADAGTIKSASGYYIGQTSDGNGMQTSSETAYSNTISIDEYGNAAVVSSGAHLRYNSASNQNRFRYFKNSTYTAQKAIQLYKKVAQPATYTLTVDAYTDDNTKDGYNLIASPVNVDPATVGMTTGDFDLYYFEQAQDLEWINYEGNNGNFNLVPGKGYLYAKKATTENETYSFELSGTPYSGNGIVTLSKTDDSSVDYQGWNLVGNPFGVTAYIGNRSFYVMNGDGSDLMESSGAIAPMKGIFVIAANDGEELQFTKSSTVGKSSRLGLTLSNGRNVIDRATVRFDEGDQLPKFQINKNHTKVYISMDGEDYAVVRGEEMGAMPVNFKAENNGTYSLSLSSENVDFSYLHLIDNLTGNDVDLLQTPSYSFEAKTTDYESRFKLVFATGDNSNDDTFAFYSNGSFVINNEGNAELQVIDIMGRIVKSESINGCANVNVNAAPGVYMLRLVNGDNVKVQKVVVK